MGVPSAPGPALPRGLRAAGPGLGLAEGRGAQPEAGLFISGLKPRGSARGCGNSLVPAASRPDWSLRCPAVRVS